MTMILLFLLLVILVVTVYYSWKLGISPMPSTSQAKKAIYSLLPMEVEGTVYELGAGWGDILMELVSRYPKVVGYELSPLPWAVAQLRTKKCLRRDFFEADLRDAGLIVCYLYPGAMRRLQEKFEKELKPGTWVISNTFRIPGWEPKQVIKLRDLYNTPVYLYEKK